MNTLSPEIIIGDFGSQVTQLIARRVRENGVYCTVVPYNKLAEEIEEHGPRGVILSGSPASVLNSNPPTAPISLYKLEIAVLGICYGQQSMASQLGGIVIPGSVREFGPAQVTLHLPCALTNGVWEVGETYTVWSSHGDQISHMPFGFTRYASSEGAPFAIIADEQLKWYGLQFHPEMVQTTGGSGLIRNFLYSVAGCTGGWSMGSYRAIAVERIRQQVGTGRVICAVSGGVDSTVTAMLLHEAIGDQLTAIFVDNGLLRKGEAEEVVSLFREHHNIRLVHVDAKKRFLAALAGITDPEQKRKIIGGLFIDIFESEARKIGSVDFLAQGTLYPDVVESVSVVGGPSSVIKSHHNVGGLPAHMKLKLVEPLRELFKDEVRELGKELGLLSVFVDRHPFPGPGLAIRLPGEVTEERLRIEREADAIWIEEIRKAGLYDQIWQAFAVLLNDNATCVMGDEGMLLPPICLRAVTATDGMTADAFRFDSHTLWDVLARTTSRITSEVRGVGRILYDITPKPPGTIEWE